MTSYYTVCWYYEYKGDLKEEGHLEDQDVDGSILYYYINILSCHKLNLDEERSSERTGSMKYGEFLDYLRGC